MRTLLLASVFVTACTPVALVPAVPDSQNCNRYLDAGSGMPGFAKMFGILPNPVWVHIKFDLLETGYASKITIIKKSAGAPSMAQLTEFFSYKHFHTGFPRKNCQLMLAQLPVKL